MAYASKKKLADNSIVPLGSNLFGVCTTASGTAQKDVAMPDFNVLVEGVTIHVYFANANTASNPTLKVGSAEARSVSGEWIANSFASFTYYNGSWIQNDVQESSVSGVTSVNGQTGDVIITEGLEPLIGTTATVTPQQVMTALEEGRDICISATGEIAQVPLVLKFTNFNRATDSAYAGNAIDVVLSQTIAAYSGAFYLFELVGGTLSMNPYPWEVIQTNLATLSDLNGEVSDLWNNFADYVPTVREVNGKALSADITLTASDVGALDGNVGGVFFGTCSSGASATAKVVTCTEFGADDLVPGTIIIVSFTATNSGAVASLTMNVNSTGAKPIKYINNGTLGNLSSAGYLKANTEYPFYYDGANWVVVFNVNSTYSALTEADMKAGTATTGRLITAARLKQAVQYHALVTSVNGTTGDVTVTVPTKTSDLTNDGDGVSPFVTSNTLEAYATKIDVDELLSFPIMIATDATAQAILQNAFGTQVEIKVPSDYTQMGLLLLDLNPTKWFAWLNGSELEISRLSASINVSNNAVTLYLRGRTSIATGVMGVDSSWTVTPLASDAEGVAY